VEHNSNFPRETACCDPGGAKSGAPGAPDDLSELVRVWPSLPANVRRGVLALVRAAQHDPAMIG
jgi:hypothetical protein